jgi:hypothetical protein
MSMITPKHSCRAQGTWPESPRFRALTSQRFSAVACSIGGQQGRNVGHLWRGAGLILLLLLLARSGGCGLVLDPRHAYSLSTVVCGRLRPTAEMLREGRFRRRQPALETTL